ncbi:MAG TPA: sigma-70 family RNA polymerase sigma factor [Chitinophagaceae bacterium]|nr:sigma-70 family RNA polymerase sigma factor [Chitinophagaceae bacterium]
MTSGDQNIDNIIDGCKNDDRMAQEQFYRKFYRAMMTLCLRYTKNKGDALEVLNTGFYKVFKNMAKYDPSKSSIYTWIRTIIINSCLDFIKGKESQVESRQADDATSVDLSPDIIAKMSANEILQLVRQLSPATQAVFNLYVIEGYNHNEIAVLMKISPGTSKWHLSEARKKLQRMINEQQRVNE